MKIRRWLNFNTKGLLEDLLGFLKYFKAPFSYLTVVDNNSTDVWKGCKSGIEDTSSKYILCDQHRYQIWNYMGSNPSVDVCSLLICYLSQPFSY